MKALDFFELLTYASISILFVVIFVWESVQRFWRGRTWREEDGRFVRDYSALRASIKTGLHVLVVSIPLLMLGRWFLGPYLFREFLVRAFWGGITGFVIAYCALSIFQHHHRLDKAKWPTCWQVAALSAFVWAILHMRSWPDD